MLEDSPRKLSQFGSEPVTFDEFFARVTNHTPATSQQLRRALNTLAGDGEVEIISPSGVRRRSDVVIDNKDRLARPRQTLLLPASRS